MLRKVLFIALAVAAFTVFAFDPTTHVSFRVGKPDTLDIHQGTIRQVERLSTTCTKDLLPTSETASLNLSPALQWKCRVKNGLIRDGGKTYVFPIRKGVKFHNGNPLTPEDVEYSFERCLLYDPAGGPMWMLWNAIFGVNSLNEMFQNYVAKPISEVFKDGEPLPQFRDKLVELYTKVNDPAIQVEGDNVVFKLVRLYGTFLTIMAHTVGWSAILDKETSIKM